MPTTRAARQAAAREAERLLLDLPADVLGHVLYYLPLAHGIALTVSVGGTAFVAPPTSTMVEWRAMRCW